MFMLPGCSTSAFKTPLEEALSSVSALGFAQADLMASPSWDHIDVPRLTYAFEEEAARVQGLLEKSGLTPLTLNASLGDLHDRTSTVIAKREAQGDALARLMQRLQIRVATFYPGRTVPDRSWESVLASTVATLEELQTIATVHGVIFALEPHRYTPFETVEQVTRLREAVPDLALVYDPSHFAMQGVLLADTLPLLRRAVHVHLRDAAQDKMQVPAGTGTVDFPRIAAALRDIDYKGTVALECLPSEMVEAMNGIDIKSEIRNLRSIVERAWNL